MLRFYSTVMTVSCIAYWLLTGCHQGSEHELIFAGPGGGPNWYLAFMLEDNGEGYELVAALFMPKRAMPEQDYVLCHYDVKQRGGEFRLGKQSSRKISFMKGDQLSIDAEGKVVKIEDSLDEKVYLDIQKGVRCNQMVRFGASDNLSEGLRALRSLSE